MMPYFFWGSGMWIFPIIGIIVMLFIVFMIFGRGGFMGGCGRNGHDRHYHDDDRRRQALYEGQPLGIRSGHIKQKIRQRRNNERRI